EPGTVGLDAEFRARVVWVAGDDISTRHVAVDEEGEVRPVGRSRW
ncbi:MAG: hypothetical protein ACJA14_000703, partial [Ilumatobacter sp.]